MKFSCRLIFLWVILALVSGNISRFPEDEFGQFSSKKLLNSSSNNESGNSIKSTSDGFLLLHSQYQVKFSSVGIQVNSLTNGIDWSWSAIGFEHVSPKYDGSKVYYERGNITEQYIIKENTVEQQFIIHKPNESNRAIVIDGQITSSGDFSKTQKGSSWKNEFGQVTVSDVFVFDATGKALIADTEVTSLTTHIELKSEALTDAEYPVLIDPEIGVNDFRISTFGTDGDISYSSLNTSIAYNSASNVYLVVWEGSITGEGEIWGQMLNGTTGAATGSAFQISDMGPSGNAAYDALAPDVASAGSSFLVVWSGDDDTVPLVDEEFEIFGQLVTASTGALSGTNFRISDMGPDGSSLYGASAPAITYNSTANEFMVVWYGDDNTAPLIDNEFEIFAQRISAAGAEVGTNDLRISDMGTDGSTSFIASFPDVTWNSSTNQYLTVWHGDDNFSSVDNEFEIFMQRLDGTSGGPVGTNDVKISDMGPDANAAYNAFQPAVTYNSAGNNFLVVWHADDDTGGIIDNENEIFGQLITGAGAESGTDFRISDLGPNGDANFDAQFPSVSHDPFLNQFLVTWHGDDNSSSLVDNEIEIYGQLITGAGAETGTNDIRLSDVGGTGITTFNAADAALVYNSTRREFLIAWEADDNVGSIADNEFEIFGQRFAELATEPANQPTAPLFTLITSISSTVGFTGSMGGADGYLVLRRTGSSPTDVPADHQVYSVNDIIGSSTVVHVGSLTSFTQSSLAANTTYYYDFFSYNGVNSSTNYKTTSPLEGDFTTLFGEPGTQGSVAISSFTTNSITVNLSAGNGSNRLLVVKAGSAVDVFPTDGFSYTPNNNIGSATDLGSSNFVVGNGTGAVTVTGLSPATVYHFRVFEFNGTLLLTNYNTNTPAGSTASRSTLSTEPTAQPVGPVGFTSITNTSFTVGYSAAVPAPTGYIAIRKQGSAPAQPADLPVDGTSYAVNDAIGGSTVAYVGASNSFSQSSLTAGTEYYYVILSYNGSATNINYLTTSPISGNQFTLANEPSNQATNISFGSLAPTSYTIGWTNGNGSERLVVVREASAVSFTPLDGTAYTGNANFATATDQGSGNKIVYRGNGNSVPVTNLTANTVYHVRVYELNGSVTTSNYITSTGTGNPASRTTLVAEPGTQASGISFASITANSVQVNFSNGNGTTRILVAKSGSAVDTNPADGSIYTANNAFGLGSQFGTGNFVVGSGSGPITVTGLSANTTYHFRVFEVSGSTGSENYNINTGTNNPNNTTTLAAEPGTQASNIVFNTLGANSLGISWTNGNGNERLILVREASAVNVNPSDGTSYTGNANFSTATDIGSGNKVVYRAGGSTNSMTVTNLNPGTVYHFRVYELNGTGSLCNYATSTPTGNPNSRTTLAAEPTAQPTALGFSLHSTTGVRLGFTTATGSPSGYIVLRRQGAAPTGSPTDGTTYTAGGSIGDGTIVSVGATNPIDDSGLTAGTTYHYTIFSFNGSGAAINYFTTLPATSSTATLTVAPVAESLTDVDIGQFTFTARWNNVSGASNYRLDVSIDDFVTRLQDYDDVLVSVNSFTVTGLNANTVYKYRVRAENAVALPSANSNIVPVTTDPPTGNVINVTGVTHPPLPSGQSSVTISASVNDGNGTKTVELFYRKITSTGAFSAPVTMNNTTGTTYTANIPSAGFDELGAEFYIIAEDLSGTDQTDPEYSYRSFTDETALPISSIVRHGGTVKSYQMISIPFTLDDNGVEDVFGPFLGDYDKTKWRLVRYQNSANVDPPTFNQIELGKSYWFNSVDEVEVKPPSGMSPNFNQETNFTLSLAAGWNQIATPYPFPIDWDDVKAANGTPAVGNYKIFDPVETGFLDENSMDPYSGGFVFADNAVSLSIPVTLKNSYNGRKARNELSKNIDAQAWMMLFTIVQSDVVNRQGAIGMHPNANESKDRWDDLTVPRFVQYLEANFYHEEFLWKRFCKDVVPTTNEYEWNLSIESNGQGSIELQWDAEALSQSQANLFLYDEADARLINMKLQSSLVIPENNRRDLKVIYTQQAEYIPDRTLVGKVWPNPASNEVNIPFVLSGTRTSYHVEIDIYDLKGIKQKSLTFSEYNAGVHTTSWDVQDATGKDVTNGVYIVKMKVNGKYLSEFSKVVINRNR